MIETNKVYKMEAIELLKQLPDNSVDLVLTDPPYNMTACEWDKPIDFQELWKELKRVGKENCAFVFTASQPFTTDLINSNREMFKYEIIWCKGKGSNFALVKKQPLKIHENIIVFQNKMNYNPQMEKVKGKIRDQKKEVEEREWRGANRPSDINYFKRIKYSDDYNPEVTYPKSILYFPNHLEKHYKLHPTQKPTSLFEWLIKSYSNENQLVLDCFVGSGTTAVASKKLNRNFICSDINEEYVRIANSRLSETAPVVTLASPTFPTEKAINRNLQVTPSASPKEATLPSVNSDIKSNFGIALQDWSNSQ